MTYRPPAISVALDLTDVLHEAALNLSQAAYDYGRLDTLLAGAQNDVARDAIDVARTKLREHLTRMARSEQVVS